MNSFDDIVEINEYFSGQLMALATALTQIVEIISSPEELQEITNTIERISKIRVNGPEHDNRNDGYNYIMNGILDQLKRIDSI